MTEDGLTTRALSLLSTSHVIATRALETPNLKSHRAHTATRLTIIDIIRWLDRE